MSSTPSSPRRSGRASPATGSRWRPGRQKDGALRRDGRRPARPRATRSWPRTPRTSPVPRPRDARPNIVDRLRLTPERLAAMAQGLRDVAGAAGPGRARWSAAAPWPTGSSCARCGCRSASSASSTRPGPTSPRTPPGICLKSGNAVLLRGQLERPVQQRRDRRGPARRGVRGRASTPDVVQLVPGDSHDSVKAADAGPRAGRRADPARRRRPDPQRRRGVDGAGDRDRRRQLPRLRRRGGRPRQGAGDRAQRQDPAHQRLQRRRVAAGARRRRRRLPAAASWPPCRTPGSPSTATTAFAAYDGVVAGHRRGLRRRVPLPRHLRGRRARPRRGDRAHPAVLQPVTPRRSSPRTRPRPGTSPRPSTRPRCWSTPRPGSPTAASSASAPRSGSAPRSCTPAARWGCRR